MSQANVYSTLLETVMYTDKLRISTGNVNVGYQVFAVDLSDPTGFLGANIYSNPILLPANTTRDVYCGVGNKVTVTGGGTWNAQELGTASSARAGVYNAAGT